MNENPTIFEIKQDDLNYNYSDEIVDELDELEIFNLIRNINDPEHPLTLQQLNVIQPHQISIQKTIITVYFTPTIPHWYVIEFIHYTGIHIN